MIWTQASGHNPSALVLHQVMSVSTCFPLIMHMHRAATTLFALDNSTASSAGLLSYDQLICIVHANSTLISHATTNLPMFSWFTGHSTFRNPPLSHSWGG